MSLRHATRPQSFVVTRQQVGEDLGSVCGMASGCSLTLAHPALQVGEQGRASWICSPLICSPLTLAKHTKWAGTKT